MPALSPEEQSRMRDVETVRELGGQRPLESLAKLLRSLRSCGGWLWF